MTAAALWLAMLVSAHGGELPDVVPAAPPKIAVGTVAVGAGEALLTYVGGEYRAPLVGGLLGTVGGQFHPPTALAYQQWASQLTATGGLQLGLASRPRRSTPYVVGLAGPTLHYGTDDRVEALWSFAGGLGWRHVGRTGGVFEVDGRVMWSTPVSYRDDPTGPRRPVVTGRGLYLNLAVGTILGPRDGWERGSYLDEVLAASDSHLQALRERERQRRTDSQILVVSLGIPALVFGAAGLGGSPWGVLAIPLVPAIAWGGSRWGLATRRLDRIDAEWTARQLGRD